MDDKIREIRRLMAETVKARQKQVLALRDANRAAGEVNRCLKQLMTQMDIWDAPPAYIKREVKNFCENFQANKIRTDDRRGNDPRQNTA